MLKPRVQVEQRKNLNINTCNITLWTPARQPRTSRHVAFRVQTPSNTTLLAPSVSSERLAVSDAGVSPLVSAILSDPELECPEGSDLLQLLNVSEAYWKALRNLKDGVQKAAPQVVHRKRGKLGSYVHYDVCVCGGTLGVLLALALQQRGHNVCILEKRKLEGRNQEWNTGREELHRLIDAGLLTEEEVESCIVSEFNPVRVGLRGMERDLWVKDVLNLGVQPRLLLDQLKRKFLDHGGMLFESTAFNSCEVFDDGVRIRTRRGSAAGLGEQLPLSPGDVNRPLACSPCTAGATGSQYTAAPRTLSCRLVLDCMGHYSPIVKQMRGGAKPQGMVVVVGGCMGGVPQEHNTCADLLYSMEDSVHDMQWFWEAFPAAGGDRTAYMFAYTDAHPDRPSFATILDKYFRQLPDYQGVPLEELKFRRVLFGAFPCYPGASPLPPAFDRVLQIGDAAAGQSPLSFGGFGSMLRHLPRLADSVHDALQADLLARKDLAWLQPYQPSLSAAWLFQRAMSVGVGQLQRRDPTSEAQQAQQQPQAGSLPAAHHLEESAGNAIVAAKGLRHAVHAEPASAERQHGRRQASWTGASSLAPAASLPSAALADVLLSLDEDPPGSGRWPPQGADCTGGAGLRAHPDPHQPAAPCQPSRGTQRCGDGAREGEDITHDCLPHREGGQGEGAGEWPRGGSPFREPPGSGFLSPCHVNRLLRANFQVMGFLGEGVLRPFLQDTLRFRPLALTMAGMTFRDPLAVIMVVRHLGLVSLLDWFRHFVMLGCYTLLHCLLSPLRTLVAGTQRQHARVPPVAPAAGQAPRKEGPAISGQPQDCRGGTYGGEEGSELPSQTATSGMDAGRDPWIWVQQLVARMRFVLVRFMDALAYGSGCK